MVFELVVQKSEFTANQSQEFSTIGIVQYINTKTQQSLNDKFLSLSEVGESFVFFFSEEPTHEEATNFENEVVKSYVFRQDASVQPVKYDAVVAPVPPIGVSPQSDFHSIREAFESGAKSVFVKAGVYTESGHIVIPDGGILFGEVPGGVFINFAGQPYSLICDGWQTSPMNQNPLAASTGTISVTHGTNVVTGTGTNFTSFSPGNFITLGDKFYMIIAIASDANLLVDANYQGNTLVDDATFKIRRIFSGNQVRNMIVFGSGSTGVIFRGVRNGSIECVCTRNCYNGYLFDDDQDLSVTSIVAMSSANDGITFKNSNSIACTILNASNSNASGIVIEDCKNIIVNGIGSENNGQCGFKATGTTGVSLYGSILKNNVSHGLLIDTSHCVVFGSAIVSLNGASGVRMVSTSKATISNISMVGNGIAFDTSDSVDTRFTNVMVDESVNEGAKLESGTSKIIIDSCSFKGSGAAGISIATGVTKCLISTCMFDENTSGSIVMDPPAGPGIIISSSITDTAFSVDPARIVSGAVVLSANIVM